MKGVLVALVLGAAPAMGAEPSDAQRTAEATMPLPIHLRAGADLAVHQGLRELPLIRGSRRS